MAVAPAATSVAAYFNSSIGFGNYFTSNSLIFDTRIAVGEALPLPSQLVFRHCDVAS